MFRIAVLQLPGVNCEHETGRALRAAGLAAEIVRWTRRDLDGFDGYVLPGGFSFQDRVRAGAVAAREPALEAVARAAGDGRPVLGICNGAQVLVEFQGATALESPGIRDTVNTSFPFTPFTDQIDDCDGYPYIRWRVTLVSNLLTGKVARVDRVAIPVVPK